MEKLIKRLQEQGNRGPGGQCICPKCDFVQNHSKGQPCNQEICPRCGTEMTKRTLEGFDEAISPDQFEKVVNKIARQTDINDHGGAILTGAELIGAKTIAERIKLVMKLHDIEGGLPKELSDYRYSLLKELRAEAAKKLDAVQLGHFESAF